MNLFTKQTHRLIKQTMITKGGSGRGQVAERGISQEYKVNRYIPLYNIKQIANKNLLYSTENYIQFLVIAYDGKESESVCVCVCD